MRTSKKNVDGRCMSSHKNKTFRSRSVVKQKGMVFKVIRLQILIREKGMVFGFQKTATAVTKPERET